MFTGWVVNDGNGFTVTVTLKEAPAQEPVVAVGVTVYTTLIGALVVFVRVPEIDVWAVPDAVPVIPEILGADQE